MSDTAIGLLVAAVTIFITNVFSYLFVIKKESRQQAVNYKIEMLDKIYTPIIKVIEEDVTPGDGYEGLHQGQIYQIDDIVNENYNLADPKLHSMIWALKEEVWHSSGHGKHTVLLHKGFDHDRDLLDHVQKHHNDLRETLGLPMDKKRSLLKRIFH